MNLQFTHMICEHCKEVFASKFPLILCPVCAEILAMPYSSQDRYLNNLEADFEVSD